ncbi:hypothetical protein N9C33_03180 [Crocinitomicaceae bacterium]|nr:hypothetical protein [Crocinitomicaceae bacterium]
MALTKITKTGISDDAVDSNKIEADAIDATKIADDAISEEHLDITAITGNTELSENAASTDVLLIYDASAGLLKKIQASNVGLQSPTVTSVLPTSVLSGDGTGNYTFTITGTGYIASAVPTLIENGGTEVSFDSFTIDSSTQITGVIAKSSLSNAQEPYDVKVTTAGALNSILTNQINIDAQPIFNTASGTVGTFAEQSTISTIDIEAQDPDSAGNLTFEIQSGTLPAGLSTAVVNENGVSKFRITGTLTSDVSVLTTNNFTVRAVDAASNTSSRLFSIVEVPSGIQSFTASGTFAVPTGITVVDALVVAGGGGGGAVSGGGGGAGGLIFMPGYPVTPGGTVTVTVGNGGCGSGTTASPTTSGFPSRPAANHIPGTTGQDSVFGTLTARGGGGGGGRYPGPQSGPGAGGPGGSGGAGGSSAPGGGPGSATQPTEPGNSGAYGFGGQGGQGSTNITPVQGYTMLGGGGGGGGAGGNGGNGPNGGGYQLSAGNGGVGKAYTIADGTTPVYYAGGGGGGSARGPGCYAAPSGASNGGQGGGGQGANQSPAFGGGPDGLSPNPANVGEANKGGGGGGGATIPGCDTVGKRGGESGGKGVVIIKY